MNLNMGNSLRKKVWNPGTILLVAVGVLCSLVTTVHAGWSETGAGPYSYTNLTHWSGGVIDGEWPATLTLTDNQVVTFDEDQMLGNDLVFLYTSGAYDLQFKGGGAERTLTIDHDVTVNLVDNGVNTVVGFGSDTAAERLNVILSGDRVLYSGIPGTSDNRGMTFVNDVLGTDVLTKIGPGVIKFEDPAGFSGDIVINEGELEFIYHGTMTNLNSLTFGGYNTLATLGLNNRAKALFLGWFANETDRIGDAATVTGIGNTRIYIRGHNISTSSETIGEYVSEAGLNRLDAQLEGTGGKPETTLNVTDLNREEGSILMMGGGVNNATTFCNLGQGTGPDYARIIPGQIDGASPAASEINGIIPWVMLGYVNTTPYAFATYGDYGFKPYGIDATGSLDDNGGTEPYVTSLAAAGSTDNVWLDTTETISGTITNNSLNTSVNISRTSVDDTIVLTSGALITRNYCTFSPRLDFGGREGIIHSTHRLYLQRGMHNDGGNGVTLATRYMDSLPIIIQFASTYTGPTRLVLGATSPQTVNAIPSDSPVFIAGGAMLYLLDGVEVLSGSVRTTRIGSIEGGGVIFARAYNGSYVYLTTGGNDESTTFWGVIQKAVEQAGLTGTMALDKVGTGILTLSGNNTYIGNTKVTEGGLFVDGSIASTNITTVSGATLGGAGSITGQVTLVNGATISPGATNAVGTLTVDDGMTVEAGAIYEMQYADTNSDSVVVNGTLNLAATATINVTNLASGTEPERMVLFAADTLNAPSGVGGWSVNGSSYSVYIEANEVVLGPPRGTVIIVR